jgi:hypothetical protein
LFVAWSTMADNHYIVIAKNFIMKKIPAVIFAFTFFNVTNAQTADTSVRHHLKPDLIDIIAGVLALMPGRKNVYFWVPVLQEPILAAAAMECMARIFMPV